MSHPLDRVKTNVHLIKVNFCLGFGMAINFHLIENPSKNTNPLSPSLNLILAIQHRLFPVHSFASNLSVETSRTCIVNFQRH